MKRRGREAALSVSFLLFALTAQASCPIDGSKESTVRTVTLPMAVPSSAYYFRSNDFVVFVDQGRFKETLDAEFKRNENVRYERLAARLQQAESGSQAVDLLRFVLLDPNLYAPIEGTVGRALEDGHATVVRFLAYPEDDDRYVKSIDVHAVRGPNTEGRRFCSDKQEIILDLVDMWID